MKYMFDREINSLNYDIVSVTQTLCMRVRVYAWMYRAIMQTDAHKNVRCVTWSEGIRQTAAQRARNHRKKEKERKRGMTGIETHEIGIIIRCYAIHLKSI